jgi:hypothetical protein
MKRKKLYYLPGMISLIGLPILAFFFIPQQRKSERIIRFFLPKDKNEGSLKYRFTNQSVYDAIKRKKIVDITLDHNNNRDDNYDIDTNYIYKRKIDFIVRTIESVKFTGDTNTVIKITLTESSTFGDLIWIINQAMIYHFNRYALINNVFYLIGCNEPSRLKQDTVFRLPHRTL